MAVSCKLDAPILPDDPDFVPYQGKAGGSATIATVDLTFLPGEWDIKETYNEVYGPTNNVLVSIKSPTNAFSTIKFNGTAKLYTQQDAISSVDGAFSTSGSGTSTYIQLSEDPFFRTSNNPIHISTLTATTMMWMVDGTSSDPTVKAGSRIIFSKKL